MRLALGFRQDLHKDQPVYTYSNSFSAEFQAQGHEIIEFGIGHSITKIEGLPEVDYTLELDCGRDLNGLFNYQIPGKLGTKRSGVYFIDSHGQPDLHQTLAPEYDDIFFAVWAKRDLFKDHASAYWLPNSVDLKWFDQSKYPLKDAEYDFGFFGSKKGLHRADPLKNLCIESGWSYDIRQVNASYKHRWPFTAEAMGACKNLFNCGQKHDLNLRIFESLAMNRPLINDVDRSSGIEKILISGTHYVPYQSYSYHGLLEAMQWIQNNPKEASILAETGYEEVKNNHLVSNRVKQILEVIEAK